MINAITRKPYSGSNVDALLEAGFSNPEFLTFRQALEIGRCVRKGETGIKLVRVLDVEETDKKTGEIKKKKAPKYFTVFNITQTDPVEA